ncbi:hypothetical protein BD779DRAFT_1474034 [Infundibulicybe gibba]|nr:hypothetical protein BD779DRAFT_1474034 [Infundibulicybe gibba]
MTAPPRRIIVDDTDPQIQYSGDDQWILIDSNELGAPTPNPRPNGPPFRNTTHFTNTTTSEALNLIFRFNGSSPQVFGTSIFTTYECFIDNTNIGPTQSRPQPPTEPMELGNNGPLCDGTGFVEEGEHTLMLNLSTTNTIRPIFWFDYITYIPSASPLESATVLVDSLDQAIVYNGGWVTDGTGTYNNAKYTRANGSSLTFNFSGTSVSWVGYIPWAPGVPNQLANGTYLIDDSGPEPFTLDESTPGYSGNLPNHVINHGDNTTTPLTLNHFVVTNNVSTVLPVSTSSLSPTVSSTATTVTTSGNNPSAPMKAIVGGVVGGSSYCALPPSFYGGAIVNEELTAARCWILMTMVHHALTMDPPEHIVLAGPSSIDPHTITQAQALNQRKVPLRAPPVGMAHEDHGAGNAIDGTVGPLYFRFYLLLAFIRTLRMTETPMKKYLVGIPDTRSRIIVALIYRIPYSTATVTVTHGAYLDLDQRTRKM